MDNPEFIPLMVPDITEEDIAAVAKVLRSGMLVQGEYVQKLENQIAAYLGVKHAVAVSSGTASLHIALLALGIGHGDEVIIPAFSFMATANVVEVVGAKPVFVDIDIQTFNVDTTLIERAITSRTKAIMPVHEFGLACDITEICNIAKKHGLNVIEDAACALGATENGKYTGTFGDAASFSFHPRKAITSGEGGMIVTDIDTLANHMRALRNHGTGIVSGKQEYIMPGFNYRMTDFQAALASSQYGRFSDTLVRKQKLAARYQKNLSSNSHIVTPSHASDKTHTWQSYHIVLDGFRDEIISSLKKKGIGTNHGAQCMPEQVFFQRRYCFDVINEFPNAHRAYTHGLVLPLYPSLKDEDIDQISEALIKNLDRTDFGTLAK